MSRSTPSDGTIFFLDARTTNGEADATESAAVKMVQPVTQGRANASVPEESTGDSANGNVPGDTRVSYSTAKLSSEYK